MLVSDIINIAKYGELQQLAVKNNTEAVLSYVNMGVLELYKRFKLGIKVEIVRINPLVSVYTLVNSDIMKVETVYDADGRELKFPSIIGSEDYDIKPIGHTTFMLKKPKVEDIAFVYTSAPTLLTDLTDVVPIPQSMTEALLHYIGYRGHGSVDGMINTENNTHYMRFDKSCKALLDEGYGDVVDLSMASVTYKGFV
jgi:hypothetical protein